MLTHRRDGSPQMSPVACSVDADGTHRGQHPRDRAEDQEPAARSARLAVRAITHGFYGDWIQVDGTAEVVSLPDAMEPLVDYYRSLRGRAPRLGRLPRRHGARAARHRAHHARARRSGPLRLSTAVAILAAGRGSRLGGDASKPLLEWRGRPLVAWAVDAALGLRARARPGGRRLPRRRGPRRAHRPRACSWSTTPSGRRGSRRACAPRSPPSTPVRRRRRGRAWAWPTSRSSARAYRARSARDRRRELAHPGRPYDGRAGQPGQAGA